MASFIEPPIQQEPVKPVQDIKIMRQIFCLFVYLLLSCVPPPSGKNWYTGEPPLPINTEALRNKVIVIDPGHGGNYDGAIGAKGTKEKDINLKVAWRLFFLLDSAGAQPLLTRFYDRDFLPDTTRIPSLKAELTERMHRANRCRTDLFISLHHNASASSDHNYNDTKTFYALQDMGTSFDAANYIHRQLVRNLKISKEDLIPGNYFVLRNSNLPALLGEPSYLSNPVQERILLSDTAVDIEARAYFQGIIDFFSAGTPKIMEIQPSGKTFDTPFPLLWARIHSGRNGIDETGIICLVDSQRVEAFFTHKDIITFRPSFALANAWHTIALTLHSRNNSASITAITTFKISLPPASLSLQADPPGIIEGKENIIRISASVFDSLNCPVADSLPVWFHASAGEWILDSVITQKGQALNYLKLKNDQKLKPIYVQAGCDRAFDSLVLNNPDEESYTRGFVKNGLSGEPVYQAQLISEYRVPMGFTDRNGFYCILNQYGQPWIKKRGFLMTKADSSKNEIKMLPVDQGALIDKRILVDPEYGGEESGPRNADGLRAADLNLFFANKLMDYLLQAGADVRCTRYGNKTMTPYQRVDASVETGADMIISIGYDSLQPHACRLYYYPASEQGKEICRHIAGAGYRILGKEKLKGYSEYVNVVLQQTPCPAIRVSPGSILQPDTGFASESYLAYCIYRGITNFFQEKPDTLIARLYLPASVEKIKNKIAVLDEYLVLPVLPDNSIVYHGLSGKKHNIRIVHEQNEILAGVAEYDQKGYLRFVK